MTEVGQALLLIQFRINTITDRPFICRTVLENV